VSIIGRIPDLWFPSLSNDGEALVSSKNEVAKIRFRDDKVCVWEMLLQWLIDWSVWIATGSLVLLGLIGTVVPFLPGHLLIFGAAFIPFFSLDDGGGVEWWGIGVLGLSLVLAQVLEFCSGAVGSKWFGGTKWGALGAFLGGIGGIFFMPFGLVLGPLAGAFLFEWLCADKTIKPSRF